MELWQYNACLTGYQERLKEDMYSNVWCGFYAGYYSSVSKHKKSPPTIIQNMFDKKHSGHADSVDVEEFQRLEREFDENYRRTQNVKKP